MFVKVDANDGNASLFQIPAGPNGLEYGSEVTITEPWKVDWEQTLNYRFTFLHYRGDKIDPYKPLPDTDDSPYWIVHWARWTDPNVGSYGVVTTDPLYILNDNGKTIDSLRHGSGHR